MKTDIPPPTCLAVTSLLHALPNVQTYSGFRSTDASSLHYDILISFVIGEVCNTHMVGKFTSTDSQTTCVRSFLDLSFLNLVT